MKFFQEVIQEIFQALTRTGKIPEKIPLKSSSIKNESKTTNEGVVAKPDPKPLTHAYNRLRDNNVSLSADVLNIMVGEKIKNKKTKPK